MVWADASAAPLARASSASAGAKTGTDSASSSLCRIDSKPPAEPTTTSASGCQSALVKTVLNQLIKLSSESMEWLNAVWTAPSEVLTTRLITASGSMTQTAVVSYPMTAAMPRARASVASGSRIATTLSKPDSDSDCISADASASASSLQVTPIEFNRRPRLAACASVRSTAAVACSEVWIDPSY